MRAQRGIADMSSDSVRWCCTGFRAHFTDLPLRGFRIEVVKDFDGEFGFILKSQAVAPKDAPFLKPPVPVSVTSEIRFLYCPWCGKKTHKTYKNQYGLLRGLSERLLPES